MCGSCWILAFLFEVYNLVGRGDHFFDKKSHQCIWDRTADPSYTISMAVLLISLPLFLITMSNIAIYRKFRASKKKLNDFNTHPSSTESHENEKVYATPKIRIENFCQTQNSVGSAQDRQTTRLFKTICLITFAFIVCWTPYVLIIIIDLADRLPMWVHLWATFLAHLHSSLSCLIFIFTSSSFKEFFNTVLCKQQEQSNINPPTISSSLSTRDIDK